MKGRGAQLRKALGTAQQAALIRTLIGKREAAGLTQLQLAKKLGQYQSFVSRLESGQRRVDVIEFLQLAEILDFDPCRVLRGLTKLSDLG
jgi:transcriptional regulator with XRE-family HTH domain